MNVYFFDDLNNFIYSEFSGALPAWRRDKAEAYKRESDKKLSAAAFFLLRAALFREFGVREIPEISFSDTGKPYFFEKKDLFFNLSHCEKGAVCAVSSREVGVDIQEVRGADRRVMERVLNPEELEFVRASKDADRGFAYLWSRKEALVKKDGRGIGAGLREINALDNAKIQTYDGGGFFISAALADDEADEIKIIKLDVKDFTKN